MDMSRGVGELLRVQRSQEHETILEWLMPVDFAHQQSDYLTLCAISSGVHLEPGAKPPYNAYAFHVGILHDGLGAPIGPRDALQGSPTHTRHHASTRVDPVSRARGRPALWGTGAGEGAGEGEGEGTGTGEAPFAF